MLRNGPDIVVYSQGHKTNLENSVYFLSWDKETQNRLSRHKRGLKMIQIEFPRMDTTASEDWTTLDKMDSTQM